ncbi:MAG: hypothetical protein ACKPCI_00765, partial [Dolichospermum sp.]
FIIPTQVLVTAWADLIDRVDLLETEQISSNLPSSGVAKFVGRDDVLTQLATQLETCERIAISTLNGMGGIGKSELALQYAQQEYKKNTYLGGIAWLNVADSDVGTSI